MVYFEVPTEQDHQAQAAELKPRAVTSDSHLTITYSYYHLTVIYNTIYLHPGAITQTQVQIIQIEVQYCVYCIVFSDLLLSFFLIVLNQCWGREGGPKSLQLEKDGKLAVAPVHAFVLLHGCDSPKRIQVYTFYRL